MGCMVLCRTFHIAPEQGQGPTPIVPHCSSPGPCPSIQPVCSDHSFEMQVLFEHACKSILLDCVLFRWETFIQTYF